jgi:hypothetical protein
VYGSAPLSVSGTVQPFAKYLALDIKASVKGMDLPRFTTYSNKYVGYAIERGKLSADLQYQIKNRALQASNKVTLNQLTFGKPSNSPDALKLPVLLAVSLLKDSQGNIDIDLPVSGSLDDPQFSVGAIVMRVIGNLLVGAITSPFRLLASIFSGGGGGGDLSYVEFEPGGAGLDGKAESSLDTLAKALADRPALKLDIIGRADPALDEAGLRQAWVDGQIRQAQARDTGAAAAAGGKGAELTAQERAKYLKQAYGEAGIKDKPRNVIGMEKSVPEAQMEEMLRAAAPVNRGALNRLATARAEAVQAYLRSKSPGLIERLFMIAPKLDAGGIEDQGKTTRVDFALK